MYQSGDAAEQIVRMSLQGVEIAAKITGEGAKNIAILLYTMLKNEGQSKGKARLTNMLKSGKELKVFTVKNEDLKKFQQEAKRYGVLYCVLKDKDNKSPDAIIDVIARAEDASKISRIVERFNLASVDKASIVNEAQKSINKKSEPQIEIPVKDEADKLLDEVLLKPVQKEEQAAKNPAAGKTDFFREPTGKSPPSEPISASENKSEKRGTDKPSVKEKLKELKNARKEEKSSVATDKVAKQKKNILSQTTHTQPQNKKKLKKSKER